MGIGTYCGSHANAPEPIVAMHAGVESPFKNCRHLRRRLPVFDCDKRARATGIPAYLECGRWNGGLEQRETCACIVIWFARDTTWFAGACRAWGIVTLRWRRP